MASKIPQKEEEGSKTPHDRPLLDLSDAAVKALIRGAKKRGYVTHDQINALLASDEVNSEQIENTLAKFSEIGINVIETKEARHEEEVAVGEEPEEQTTEGNAGRRLWQVVT
jgi:RNA polymerase primary sigma factor